MSKNRKKKKSQSKRKTGKIDNLSQTILEILRKNHSKTHNHSQISAKLGVDDASSRNQIIKKLKILVEKGSVQEIDRGKYIITFSENYYTGRVDIAGRGQGYVIVDELEDDILIKNKNLNKALNGDIVEVYVFSRKKDGKREGERSEERRVGKECRSRWWA